MLHLTKADGDVAIHILPAHDRQTLYVMMREIADEVERFGATGLIHTAEYWAAAVGELKPGQMPSDVPTRREVLQVSAATSDGRRRDHAVEFSRNNAGQIELGKSLTTEEESQWWGPLEPIRQVWSRWRGEQGGSTSGGTPSRGTDGS
jgi:hypothetical protein